jgi:hypothetical protein
MSRFRSGENGRSQPLRAFVLAWPVASAGLAAGDFRARFPTADIDRNRVNRMAEQRIREGASQRDVGSLRCVVDLEFCSSWGDGALELLGDLAFQDGRFGEARAMYNRLVADRAGEPLVLVHPDPSVDLARVAAKKLLCQAAADEKPPGPTELDLYTRRQPSAAGSLAGRKGSCAQILAQCLTTDHLTARSQPDSRWPTFAGSLHRTEVVAGPIGVGSLQRRIEIERVSVNSRPPYFHGGRSAENAPPERLLAVPDDGADVPQARYPTARIPRRTLTAFGHQNYAGLDIISDCKSNVQRQFA